MFDFIYKYLLMTIAYMLLAQNTVSRSLVRVHYEFKLYPWCFFSELLFHYEHTLFILGEKSPMENSHIENKGWRHSSLSRWKERR